MYFVETGTAAHFYTTATITLLTLFFAKYAITASSV